MRLLLLSKYNFCYYIKKILEKVIVKQKDFKGYIHSTKIFIYIIKYIFKPYETHVIAE